MDVIQAAREVGRAIQADPFYQAFWKANTANDQDEELQALIGEFELQKQKLNLEVAKPDETRDNERVKEINEKVKACYQAVVNNSNMQSFAVAKKEADQVIERMNRVINLCCAGENPDTCNPDEEAANCAAGDCSACAGCN